MNAKEFRQYLKTKGACNDAMIWQKGKSLSEVWNTCERGDWMLWLIYKADLCDLKLKTLIKVECAELVIHLMKDERSKTAIKVARDFAEGNATQKELSAAAYAAYAAAAAAEAAAAAYAAAAYAAYAADAAAYAAAAAAEAAAAAYAADAYAAYAADAAAYAAARGKTLSKCADICRKHLPEIIIN